MIEKIHDNLGYNDVMDFINTQLSNPTYGQHSDFIAELENQLPVQDYYLFIQEMFDRANNYVGAFVVTETGKALYIEQGVPVCYQGNAQVVENLIKVTPQNGIDVFISGSFPILSVPAQNPYTVQFYIANERGNDVAHVYLKLVNEILSEGVMMPILFYDSFLDDEPLHDRTPQRLASYNVKIDRNVVAMQSFRSAKNQYTTFEIEVAEGLFERFSYAGLGQRMYVQKTEYSDKNLKLLEREGVVWLN